MAKAVRQSVSLVVAALVVLAAPVAAHADVIRPLEMVGSGSIAGPDRTSAQVQVQLPCPGEKVGFNPQPDPPGDETARLVVRVGDEQYELSEVAGASCTVGDVENRDGGTHVGSGRAGCGGEGGFIVDWRLTDGGLGGPDTAEITISGPAEAAACSNNLHVGGALADGDLELRTMAAVKSLREDCFGLVATIKGTEFDDHLVGTPGPDVIQGLNGNDIIRGLGGEDLLCGGLGDDSVSGGPGGDDIAGDWISGLEQAGDDLLLGDAGVDRLQGDVVDAGPLALIGGNDRLYGGDDGDFLVGDVLGSTAGDDVRTGGDDVLHGGDGGDFIAGDNNGGIGGDDVSRGGDGDDRLRGDEIIGEQGEDFVIGGDDRLIGGHGNDHLRGDDFDPTNDDAADSLTAGDDALSGNDGDDVLEGDWFDGGLGNDILRAGDDRLVGDAGADLLHGDSVIGAGGDDIVKLGRDRLYGGPGPDEIHGDTTTAVETHLDGSDILYGQSGGDRLFGEFGPDRHLCGAGRDFADGGPAIDLQFGCETIVDIP